MRMRLLIGACLFLAVALAACGGEPTNAAGDAPPATEPDAGSTTAPADDDAATGEPLTIGYLASTSGFCSQFSQEEVAGARLAVEAINAEGGVLGRPLQLSVRDDQATPEVGVQQARDLVLNEEVKFLAGTCSSAVGLAVRQSVADPSSVLYVAPVADPEVFADTGGGDSFVFGTLPTTQVEGSTVADFVASTIGPDTVSFIGEDYSYSYTVFEHFEEALADVDEVEIVSNDFATVSDYTPFINKLLSEEPDFVYSNLIVSDLVTFSQQAGPLGLFDQLGEGAFIGFYDLGTLIALEEQLPVGQYGYTYYPEPYLYPGTVMDAMAEQYQASTGSVATGAAGDGYNQIWMIAQGIEMAGVAEPAEVAEALSGATIDFVQGEVQIRECDHLPVVPIAIGTIAAADDDRPHPGLTDVTYQDTESLYPSC